jgi:hypothetical protein
MQIFSKEKSGADVSKDTSEVDVSKDTSKADLLRKNQMYREIYLSN